MKQKILSVFEAFSQQPNGNYVCRLTDNPYNKHQHKNECIKEIKLKL